MSRARIISVVAVILALGGLSVYINRDSFRSQGIQISSRPSPWMLDGPRGRRFPSGEANPVTFSFDHYYRFTSIRVVAVSDAETNKYPHKLWDLDSASNSAPTMTLVYGARIQGMKPAAKGMMPEPLVPDVKYRLLVKTSDGGEAQHDFSTTKRQ